MQPLPPAVRRFAVGLDRRYNQRVFSPGDGYVQGVQLFAPPGGLFLNQCFRSAGWRRAFADQKHKLVRGQRLAGPVDKHAHAIGASRGGVGVEQQHGLGLQALGTVNGEQPHGIGVDSRRCLQATRLERADKSIWRCIAATIDLQSGCQQRPQIGQHRPPAGSRCSSSKAGQHVATVVNSLQRIVWWQGVQKCFITAQSTT